MFEILLLVCLLIVALSPLLPDACHRPATRQPRTAGRPRQRRDRRRGRHRPRSHGMACGHRHALARTRCAVRR